MPNLLNTQSSNYNNKQMKPAKHILLILQAFFLFSCAEPLISNLQKGSYKYSAATDDVLGVSIGIMPVQKAKEEEEKPKTFLDLRDSLPHAYMRLLSSKEPNPDKFINYLHKELSTIPKKPAEKKPTDFTTYKFLLNFSHWNKFYNNTLYMHPNTRLEYLTTYLNIPANSAIGFYTIDRLENEFDEIDLGTLSRDQSVTFNAKLTGELGTGSTVSNTASGKTTGTSGGNIIGKTNVYDEKGSVIGTLDNTSTAGNTKEGSNTNTVTGTANAKANGEIGYLNNETIKEAVAVKLKRLRTGFSFSNSELVIAQRGRPLGDISYNTFVTVTLKVSNPTNVFPLFVYNFDAAFESNGIPIKADKLNFTRRLINFVPCSRATDIQLTTRYEGAIRAVGNNEENTGENALEYDDKVTFYKFDKSQENSVNIDKNMYCKRAYKIVAKDAASNNYVLKIANPVPEELDIFMDDKPELFLQWILEQQSNPIKANLITSRFRIYFENTATKARVFLNKDALNASELAAISDLKDIKLEIRNP